MAHALTVSVPATAANLGPGFDALGLALPVRNRFTFSNGKPDVVCGGRFGARLEGGRDNLVLRAVRRVCEWAQRPVPDVRVTVDAELPPGSGLGSSATAVVAGVVAAARWLDLRLDAGQLLDICADLEGHPDNVAPALLGGIVVAAIGEGETRPRKVHWLSIPVPAGWQLVVATPDFSVDTASSRAELPDAVPLQSAVWNLARTGLLVAALHQGRVDLLAAATQDVLHERRRLARIPGAEAARSAAVDAGAAACVLSGSGPTLLAFLGPGVAAQPVQQALKGGFSAAGLASGVRSVAIEPRGAVVEQ
jgi:homoserine kinase